jgi:hypothetical protein
LLTDKLSDVLKPEQKTAYVQNLLQEMRRDETIRIRSGGPSRGPGALWELYEVEQKSAD